MTSTTSGRTSPGTLMSLPPPASPCAHPVVPVLRSLPRRADDQPLAVQDAPRRPVRRAGPPVGPRRDVPTAHREVGPPVAPGRIAGALEDSPSGLWRSLGKRVGGNPSGVRISHPPHSTRPLPGTPSSNCCRRNAAHATIGRAVLALTVLPAGPR